MGRMATPHTATRWAESMKLWEFYLAMGGSLDPEYDPQSPFNNDYYPDGPLAQACVFYGKTEFSRDTEFFDEIALTLV